MADEDALGDEINDSACLEACRQAAAPIEKVNINHINILYKLVYI